MTPKEVCHQGCYAGTVETVEGNLLYFVEEGGIRFYKGWGWLRELAQRFNPKSFVDHLGSAYGDDVIEQRLAAFPVIGQRRGRYYGLDTDGLNAHIRERGGISIVVDGEDLSDTLKVQL
ncbi:MAG: hypothetical protein Q8Q96_00560, partial [bacterium]|nr:hypothetical protein [bacterium]